MYHVRYYLLAFIASSALCFFFSDKSYSQQKIPTNQTAPKDSFFLANKRGLLGKLGRSLVRTEPFIPVNKLTIKNVTPYASFKGKTIHCIIVNQVVFGVSVNDTTQVFRNFFINAANRLHSATQEKLIKANLLFKEGERLNPNLIAENTRYLRNLPYLQDARIEVNLFAGDTTQVDMTVFFKDVFSISALSKVVNKSAFLELRDNNIMGTGQQLTLQNMLDFDRVPNYGWGAEYLKRNVAGSFINLSLGYQNVASAYSDGKRDETYAYTRLVLPLVSPNSLWTGATEIAIHYNTNRYVSDSLFNTDNQYNYNNLDVWAGYNISTRTSINEQVERKVKHFLALRVFDLTFNNLPNKYKVTYNPQYASVKGILAGFTSFKQEYYHANFIYGFGRNEDVPEGYNISFVGGWTEKVGAKRPYAGINLEYNYFTSSKNYFDYTLKFGGYYKDNQYEDMSLLLDLENFTKLRRFKKSNWYCRHFFSGSIAHQFRRLLDAPLILNSTYGIPQFTGDSSTLSTSRATFNGESVFYNTWKFFGFSFAPFTFANISFLKTDFINGNNSFGSNINGYVGLGFGVRTRNENLVFGTIELRAFYFPRTLPGMGQINISLISNLIFTYNSQYIRRPDFVGFN